MMTISNIRTMLALSIIAFAIYSWYVKSFSTLICFLLIGLASLIHSIGVVVLGLFLLMLFMNDNVNAYIRSISAVICVASVIVFGKKYLLLAVEKGSGYISSYQESTGYFYVWEMFLSIIALCITILLIYKFYRFNKPNIVILRKQHADYFQFIKAVGLISIINLGLFFLEFNVALRLSWLITIFDVALIPILSYLGNNKMKIYIYNTLIFCSIFMLIISCSRGDMCSLKFM